MKNIKGLDKVMRNLNKEIRAIKGRTVKGMIESSIIIRRDMDNTPPKIPVDLNNLRISWFTVTSTGDISSNANFKGKKSSKLSSDHASVVAGYGSQVKRKNRPALIMGLSVNYAMFVHENIDANFSGTDKKKGSRRNGAGAKFLEASINRNKKEVLRTIAKEAKIR